MLDQLRYGLLGRLKHPFRRDRASKRKSSTGSEESAELGGQDSTVSGRLVETQTSPQPLATIEEQTTGNAIADGEQGLPGGAAWSNAHENALPDSPTLGHEPMPYISSVTVDRNVDVQPAVVEEHVRPHVHTVYHPQRTRSIHIHEHRLLIQPIIADEQDGESRKPRI